MTGEAPQSWCKLYLSTVCMHCISKCFIWREYAIRIVLSPPFLHTHTLTL